MPNKFSQTRVFSTEFNTNTVAKLSFLRLQIIINIMWILC